MKTMTRRAIFTFGVCVGVLCTITFGLTVYFLDNTRGYSVYETDDHTVTLKSEDGVFIEVQLENVPDAACFDTGAIWLIDYLP